jgi:hypothetical protein
MNIRALDAPPDTALSLALGQFESRFTYPLGEGTAFRISHGEDYSRFYRAMGESRVVVAERDGEVLGTLAGAVRQLRSPHGESLKALYVGDLKVIPGLEAGIVLVRLAAVLTAWATPRVTAAFGVAMDGTRKTPPRYTGRFGIPAFTEIGKIMVLRLACEPGIDRSRQRPCAEAEGLEIFRALTCGDFAPMTAFPLERSAIDPQWIRLESGLACGMLEDTGKAKRLFEVGGGELRSAHLSHFAFAEPPDGARLLLHAAGQAAAMEYPALFCAVPEERAQPLVDALGSVACKLAPATVYGAGMAKGRAWHLNTSEI